MENDILRVENLKNADANINSSHFKNNTETNSQKKNKTSIPSLIRDERNKTYLGSEAEIKTLAPKPKILNAIILGALFLL